MLPSIFTISSENTALLRQFFCTYDHLTPAKAPLRRRLRMRMRKGKTVTTVHCGL
jgi:hypothetical protein